MSKDGWKSLLPTMNSAMCIGTFLLVLFQGQARSLGANNATVLVIGITASLLWLKFRKQEGSMIANIMVQVGVTIGFVSTFQSVWVKPHSEVTLCWFVWTASYTAQTFVVILRKGKRRDFVYPLNCLFLHLAVAILSLR
jgi:hypothetical protein